MGNHPDSISYNDPELKAEHEARVRSEARPTAEPGTPSIADYRRLIDGHHAQRRGFLDDAQAFNDSARRYALRGDDDEAHRMADLAEVSVELAEEFAGDLADLDDEARTRWGTIWDEGLSEIDSPSPLDEIHEAKRAGSPRPRGMGQARSRANG